MKLSKLELSHFQATTRNGRVSGTIKFLNQRLTETLRYQESKNSLHSFCRTGAAESAITGLPLSLKIITKLPFIFLETDLVNHSC